jgi:hypothetical protein
MRHPHAAPALGFELAELVTQIDRDTGATPVAHPTPAPLGRPRTLVQDAQPFSVRLSPDQRAWLLRTAAERTLRTGERGDASQILRELIDQARGAA